MRRESTSEDDDEVKEDVNLACKDGQDVEAQKIFLVTSNSFFKNIKSNHAEEKIPI